MYEIILGQKFCPLATRTSAGGFQSEGRHISAAEPPQLRIVNSIDSNDMLAGASQSVEISRIWWGEYSCYDTGKWRQWLVNIKIAAPSQFFRKEMLMESIKRLFNWENDKEVNIVQEEQLPTAKPPDRNTNLNVKVNVSIFLFFQLSMAAITRRFGLIRRCAPSPFRRWRERKR